MAVKSTQCVWNIKAGMNKSFPKSLSLTETQEQSFCVNPLIGFPLFMPLQDHSSDSFCSLACKHFINESCYSQCRSGRMPTALRPSPLISDVWSAAPFVSKKSWLYGGKGNDSLVKLHWRTRKSKSISLINSHLIDTHLQATCQSADSVWEMVCNLRITEKFMFTFSPQCPSLHCA